MLKAWEKVKKYAGEIVNIKAWLTRLTRNLCIDIHRERSRDANKVENIEGIPEEKGLLFWDDRTESALETEEKKIVIRKAIDNLPNRLRETHQHFFLLIKSLLITINIFPILMVGYQQIIQIWQRSLMLYH